MAMHLEGKAKMLKVIVGEAEHVYQRPLFEALVFAAKKYKIAGATVTRGILSFGADNLAHNLKVFDLSTDMPIVIEMIDREERIEDFSVIVLKLLTKAESGGIVLVQDVDVLRYSR
jgi:hypothetical protein